MRAVNNIVLNSQIFVKKIRRKISVGFDAADFSRGVDSVFRLFPAEKIRNSFLVEEIKRLTVSGQDICVSGFLQAAHNG